MSTIRVQECPSCFGQGRWGESDGDSEDEQVVTVACETCLGLGQVSRCSTCGDLARATDVELNDGLCGWCAADKVIRQGRRRKSA